MKLLKHNRVTFADVLLIIELKQLLKEHLKLCKELKT
jgi:6-phosphogluconate dehydrogenase